MNDTIRTGRPPAGALPPAPPVQAPASPSRVRSASWWRLGTASAARVLLLSTLGLMFWTVAPAVMGWEPTTVMTGSMEPRISPGDVVVARPVDDATLLPDQVLLVDDPDHPGRLRLHRLVGVEADGRLQLRGDANAAADSSPVARSAVHGVAVLRIPYLGSPVVWLAGGHWSALVGLLAVSVLLLFLTGTDGRGRPGPGAATPEDTATPEGTATLPADATPSAAPANSVTAERRGGPQATRRSPNRWSPTRRSPRGWSAWRRMPRRTSRRVALTCAVVTPLVIAGVLLGGTAGAGWAAGSQQPSSSTTSAAYFSCASAVAATTPLQSYRFDETAGTTAADSSGNNKPGTYRGTPTFGEVGPCPRDAATAVTLDGSTEYVSTANAVTNPTTYSTEIWFRTTTTRGGMLIGLGSTTTGASGTNDRVVYLRNDGKLSFGAFTTTTNVLTSTAAYNDGQWHHVVATQSSAGMRLYVDAVQVGTNTVTAARSMTGYWRVGYNSLTTWPSAPTSAYLAGTVANAAVYSTALTAAQVTSHFGAAAPYLSCRESVQAAAPAEFFRMSEGGGTLAQDWSTNGRDGTYYGTVTFGTTGPCGTTRGITLDGSSEYLSTSTQFPAPTTYSLETWFRTSGTKGGMIMGFGNYIMGDSTQDDRLVYLSDAGQLFFGTYPGSIQVVQSATGLNNGAWHHMVASQSAAGMRLYVDGALVGSNTVTTAENYSGYWRIGYNPISSWPSAPASAYFAGSLINAAVYPTALTATQVAAHYAARTAAN